VSLGYRIAGYEFSSTEIRDLLIAWLALGVAFAIFFAQPNIAALFVAPEILVVSLLTAGVAFLLHEVAHKVVAVHYDQIAEFRADYSMLFLAIMSAMIGIIFAAPGAVHHQGYVTKREHGHIAIAGPVINLLLAAVFVPLYVAGIVLGVDMLGTLGRFGIIINLFLAAFNLIPFGPLDGKTVIGWSKLAWLGTFLLSVLLTIGSVLLLGLRFQL